MAGPLDSPHEFGVDSGGFFSYGPGVTSSAVEGEFCAVVPAHTGNAYDVAVAHNSVGLVQGTEYDVTFSARSTADVSIRAQVGINSGTYPTIHAETLAVSPTGTDYSFAFTSTADAAAEEAGGQLSFQVGNQGQDFTFCIDNFSMVAVDSGNGLIPNGDFASGELAPWFAGASFGEPDFTDGALCVAVPAGGSIYDGVGYNGLAISEGSTYTLSYTAWASAPRTIRTIIGESGGAYRTVLEENPAVTPTPTPFTHTFTSPLHLPAATTDGGPYEGQLAFQVGARGDAYTFCIDDVSLVASSSPPPLYTPETGSAVRVNQVGYLPDGPKRATVVTDSATSLPWELRSLDTTVLTGQTTPAGTDPTAGLAVHTVDFSGFTTPGTYTLVVDGQSSYDFEIAAGLYQQLRQDALNYFYLARSGVEIDAAIVGEQYARAAGHIGVAPNLGDTDVACLTDEVETGPYSYGDWTCDYTLDVTGGWYDAGDHGKYVVNGGIAVAQVLSTVERATSAPSAVGGALGDGTLDIPAAEGSNGVPDALDEARWELDFLMSMMVPSGEFEGMVHHKVHDMGWTGLPLAPADDPQARYLHRPSTAATLNVAATAAQGSRLWAEYDEAYAAELLEAALTTWDAALANPAVYAPADMGANGGGPYDDDDVRDEFYWAAAELFLTTGEQRFENFLLASPLHTADIWTPSGFSWGETAALGRLDLATVESDISGREAIRDSVVAGAEKYLDWQAAGPFGTTYPGLDGRYEWGSNSMVLNNQVVLGTAFDLTGDQRFADGVVGAMDYLLGRNALNNSYVTGYGDVFSENQHSRWFANSINPDLPRPPAGSIAGGPNSTVGTWDPVISGLYNAEYMCAPQACYVDDIQSWSTNEITVNWNSALSWVASFVADQHAGISDAGTVVRITSQPSDVTVVDGAVASFAAAARADPIATVRWQTRRVGGTWADLPLQTAATLDFIADRRDSGAEFRAVFTNEFGSASSDAAVLTVAAAGGATPGAPGGAASPPVADNSSGGVARSTRAGELGRTGTEGDPLGWLIVAAGLMAAGAALLVQRRRSGVDAD